MLSVIFNYAVRVIIICLGIIMVSGLALPISNDDGMLRIIGIIFILFGTYRIILYHNNRKRYAEMYKEEDSNEE